VWKKLHCVLLVIDVAAIVGDAIGYNQIVCAQNTVV
ncbi:hypothetical protein EVA_19387, partial [gut metagenome]